MSNLLLRLARVQPRDEISHPRTPAQLQHLVQESRRLGLIESDEHAVLSQALHAPTAAIGPLVVPVADIIGVPAAAPAAQVVETAARTGRTRLVVWDGDRSAGVVHVRDAYLARRRGSPVLARDLAYRLPELTAEVSISDAVAALRAAHSQLALVRTVDGSLAGLVFLDDLLTRLLVTA